MLNPGGASSTPPNFSTVVRFFIAIIMHDMTRDCSYNLLISVNMIRQNVPGAYVYIKACMFLYY